MVRAFTGEAAACADLENAPIEVCGKLDIVGDTMRWDGDLVCKHVVSVSHRYRSGTQGFTMRPETRHFGNSLIARMVVVA